MNNLLSTKILQIGLVWFPEGGGLDRFFYELIKELLKEHINVKGLIAGDEKASEETGGSVKSFATTNNSMLKKFSGMIRNTKSQTAMKDFDLLVSHFALHVFPLLPTIGRTPFIVHFHGPWSLESAAEGGGAQSVWIKHLIERLVYRRADQLIVLSEAFKTLLHQEYGVPRHKISVIPGAVHTQRFQVNADRATARQQLGWADRPTVLIVRRLANRMGLEDAIVAIEQVRVNVPGVQLLIAGRGRLSNELQLLIESRNLTDHVRLLGFVPDDQLPLAYRAANLSIVPTVSLEGFGLITLESLAAGTPVLVTPIGGLPEVVKGLSPELILSGIGSQAIASGLTRALTGHMTLPTAEACVAYVQQNYDWSIIVQRIMAVYQDVIYRKSAHAMGKEKRRHRGT